ncbi:hypothetical protein LXA43DRAFT_905611 [Ganoderma leucocontextum]|nr:hypothetical protein LXA43DRAFT_905611 [Ganoderma leucocontextum]
MPSFRYLTGTADEVELFWKKDVNGASVLFFLTRYVVLFYNLSILWFWWPFTETVSLRYLEAIQTIGILCYVPWGAFSALRVFALTGGEWYIAAIVFLLSMGTVAINFAVFWWFGVAIDPVWGLPSGNFNTTGPQHQVSFLIIISRGSLIVADLIVIIVTWLATYDTAAMAHGVFSREGTIVSFLLLRDGTIYFVLMVAINVMHLAFSTSSVLVAAGSGNVSDVTQFSEPLTAIILVSRFMLNLQETRRRTAGVSGSRNGPSSNFDRIVGSIGESLGPGIVDPEGDVPGDEWIPNSLGRMGEAAG